MSKRQRTYRIPKLFHPMTFIDKRAWKALPVDGSPGEVLGFAFAFDQDGRLPWDTIISSCIKKSGKTTMNGAVTLGRGFTQEAFNLK